MIKYVFDGKTYEFSYQQILTITNLICAGVINEIMVAGILDVPREVVSMIWDNPRGHIK